MSINTYPYGGVGVLGMPWTFHAAGYAASAKRAGHAAIPRPDRSAAAANVASVKRGTT